MHRDSLSVLPKGVPPVGLEADPVAHRRASQPRLTVPHDLVPGVRIVLAGARCPPRWATSRTASPAGPARAGRALRRSWPENPARGR